MFRNINADEPIITTNSTRLTAMYGGNALTFMLPTPIFWATPKKSIYLIQSHSPSTWSTLTMRGKTPTTIAGIIIDPVNTSRNTPMLKITLTKKVAATKLRLKVPNNVPKLGVNRGQF